MYRSRHNTADRYLRQIPSEMAYILLAIDAARALEEIKALHQAHGRPLGIDRRCRGLGRTP